MIISILELLNENDRLKLLKMEAIQGWTPLGMMIVEKSMKALQAILSPLSHEERLAAIDPGTAGTDTRIHHFFNWLRQQKKIYPMLTPPETLIFYNSIGREDESDDERDALERAFTKLGLRVTVVRNFQKHDLLGVLGKIKLAQHRSSSGLVVAVMAHGLRGCILDVDNQLILINDIILDMDSPEMQGKPKMLILQCCQGFPEPEEQRNESVVPTNLKPAPPVNKPSGSAAAAGDVNISILDPPIPPSRASASSAAAAGNYPPPRPCLPIRDQFEMEAEPIELKRKDFSLLISTVSGEVSVRNRFIPILSKCIAEAEEGETIDKCFTWANDELQQLHPEQTAEHRNTLRKSLFLGYHYKPPQESDDSDGDSNAEGGGNGDSEPPIVKP